VNPNFEQVVAMWSAVGFFLGIRSVLALDRVDPYSVSAPRVPDVSLFAQKRNTLDRDRGGRLQLNVKGDLSVHEKISQRGSSATAPCTCRRLPGPPPTKSGSLSNSLDDGRAMIAR
jgi:hypothetical protein